MAGSMDFRLNLLANTTGLQQGMDGAKFAVNALVAAMAAVGVGVSIKGLAEAADSYANLSARISIATKDGGNFGQAMAGVHQVALMTNTSLDSTGMLFTKVNDIGKQMGLTQQDSLDLVKTINMAIQTGGGSAASSEAAIVQLTQALQSGVLRGDEFNSIMEQAPGISSALAKSLGVTTGELRKMAGEGQLSSTTVIKALREQSASIQADYDQFPLTIGKALQKIQTQWQILIGTMDQANGASTTVAQWLAMLAEHMGIVTVLLDDIGEGFVWVGDQLKKIDTATIEAFKTALESAYDTLKILASSVGAAFEITADVLNTALGAIFDFGSGVDAVSDKTNGLTKVLQAINVVIGFAGDGFSAISIGLNLLAGVVYDVAGAFTYWKSKLLFGDAKDKALQEYGELASKAQEYYQKASNGALEFKSKGIEAIGEISKTQKEKDAEAIESSKQKLDKLLADQKTEVDGKKSSEEDKVKAVQAYADEAVKANNGVLDSAVQLDLQSKGYMVTLDSTGKVVVTSMAAAKQATEENSKAAELAQEKAKQAEIAYQEFIKSSAVEKIQIQKQIEQAKVSGDLTALASAQASLSAIDTKEAELNVIRKQRNAEVISGVVGANKAAEVAAKGAAEALGINLDISLNRVSKGFKEAGGQVLTLSKEISGLGVSGKEASNLIYEGWIKWLEKAKSPAEIDFAKVKLDEFKEKGVFSTRQVELGMQAIQRATAKLPDDLDEVGAAFERLGIKTKEQLKLAAQSALADFNTVQASGQATAEGIKQAYERAMQAAAASGDVAVIAATKSKSASLGLEVQVDKTGKTSVKSMDELTSANERVKDSAHKIGDGYRHSGQVAREEAKSSEQAWLDVIAVASKQFDSEMKRQGEALKKGIYEYNSYSKTDVISQLKSKGYDDKEAERLAGSIWSKGLEADRSARNDTVSSGNPAMDALIKQEFDSASSKGLTTQWGTNKINELLRQVSGNTLTSSGQSSKPVDVNSLAPQMNKSVVSNTTTSASKSVAYNINIGGQVVTLYGDESDQDPLDKMMRQLETLKKGM